MKRLICALLVFCFLPLLAAAENVSDSLVVGIYSTKTLEIRPFDPQERDILSVYDMVYESLIAVDDEGLPQPYLAEDWTVEDNGNVWTFTLRDNLYFSDGSPLTAADVAASGQYILTMAANEDISRQGFYRNIQYMVSKFSAADDRTLVVKAASARPYYGLLYAMTFPVVPASQVDMSAPYGSGPYKFGSFEPANNYMSLTVNEHWWQSAPQVKEIVVSTYVSNKDLITAYEYARVDTAFTRLVSAAQYKSGVSSLSVTYSTRQLETLLMNFNEIPLENLNVRRAIRAAIDKAMIANNVYMGMTIDTDTPVPPGSWLYYDQELVYQYDLELAQQLLEEEGWVDSDNDGVLDKIIEGKKRNLHLRLFVYEDPDNNVRFETANMIADMLEKLKMRIKITPMTFEEVQEKLQANNFDLVLASFQMDVVPDAGFLLMKGNTGNYGRYSSAGMTELCKDLRHCVSQTEFAYTWQAIQKQFADDIPFICLFYRAGAVLTRKMYSSVRDYREFELLRGIEDFGR
ncbi:MAG: peptide ABC transporter substrate-binding protein [Clostridiales bacterium]|nr:peptide ABC transporter substrate-binding protein [Clostridiales bacterium]